MNILNKIINFINNLNNANIPIDNTELALQLFNTLSVGASTSPLYETKINSILKECTINGDFPDRQLVLLKVVELIGEPTTPKQRYIVAISYAWSKVKYREKAIKYIELYLSNELYEDAYKHKEIRYGETLEEKRKRHIVEFKIYLAKAYKGLKDLDSALKVYEDAINIYPEDTRAYYGKVEILSKMKKFKECDDWLKAVKRSDIYRIYTYTDVYGKTYKDNTFCKSIDSLLKSNNEKNK